MPFTFVHPIAVLPLTRWMPKGLSITGLIVGSMIPDFSYFITLDNYFRFGHSFTGLLLLDLPLALIVCLVFHQVVRDPLINNLPDMLYARLARYRYQHWNEYFKKRWITVCISILLGGITHLAWDAFTHQNVIMNEFFPWLDTPIDLLGRHIRLFNLVHLVFSVLGLILGIAFLLRLPMERKKPRNFSIVPFWTCMLMMTGLFATLMVFFLASELMKEYPSLHMGYYAIFMTSAFLLSLLLCGLGFYQQSLRLRAMRRKVRVEREPETA